MLLALAYVEVIAVAEDVPEPAIIAFGNIVAIAANRVARTVRPALLLGPAVSWPAVSVCGGPSAEPTSASGGIASGTGR